MNENQKRITARSWSETVENARPDPCRSTEPSTNSEDHPGQTELAGENVETKDVQALARDTDYSDDRSVYPPEVLRLLDVICEVIMGAASVEISRTDEPQ